MTKFEMEVRKISAAGEVYPPNTLYILRCGVQRFLREECRRVFIDDGFKLFWDSLDAEMKQLTNLGVVKKQADEFSEGDEDLLWEKKVFLVTVAQEFP